MEPAFLKLIEEAGPSQFVTDAVLVLNNLPISGIIAGVGLLCVVVWARHRKPT